MTLRPVARRAAAAPSPLLTISLVLALAASAGCGRSRLPRSFPGAPVVIISVDTLRSDHLPFYGYAGVTTPALSALRDDSILFERAYTHVPLTLPAHVSLFTGLLPNGHGVHDNLGYSVNPKVPTLAELLRSAGYATGGAVSSVVMKGGSGIGRGFDLYDDDVVPTRPNQALNRVQRPGGEAEEALAAWLDGVKDRPFFAFLHLYEPHSPYEPPEPFRSRFANPYDGEIAAADAIVGKFLDRLKSKNLYDRAVVIFLSDHGEGLGDHGENEHGVFLYREVLQVPLLVKLPKGAGATPGTRVATPVQLTDVFTTVARAAGIPRFQSPAGTVSLVDVAAGDAVPERRLFAETFFPRIHFGWSELRSLLDGRWHYIEAPRPELYDLSADPAEVKDLVGGSTGPLRAMRIEMERIRTAFQAPAGVDREAARQLASLGYLSSGASAEGGPLDDPKDHIATVQTMKEALSHLTEGRPARAVEVADRLLAANPRMLDIWELRSLALQRMGRVDDAIASLRKMVESAPPGSTHYLRLAATHCLEMGRPDDAARYAEEAGRKGDASSGETLARAFLEKGDLARAEAAARALLETPGSRPAGNLLLARIAARQGRLADALALTEAVVRDDGGRRAPEGLHFLRGDVLARMDRPADAETEFREEIRLYPATLAAWSSLAFLMAAQNRPEEVRRTVDEMLAKVPGVDTWLFAVRTWKALGDARSSEACRQEALRRFPEEPRLGRTPPPA